MEYYNNMTRPHLNARFLTILERHKGLSQAISVPEMAEQLGLGRGKGGQRVAQLVKRELVEKGFPIGSSCGAVSGYYLVTSDEEFQATMGQFKSRWHSLGMAMQAMKRHYEKRRDLQLAMF